jgi:hypothetical protein
MIISDVGIYDRVVIQDILKEIAQTQQVDLNAKQKFKGSSPGVQLPFASPLLISDFILQPLVRSGYHQRSRRLIPRRPSRPSSNDGEVFYQHKNHHVRELYQ